MQLASSKNTFYATCTTKGIFEGSLGIVCRFFCFVLLFVFCFFFKEQPHQLYHCLRCLQGKAGPQGAFQTFLTQDTCPIPPSCLSASFMSIRDSMLPDLIGLTFPSCSSHVGWEEHILAGTMQSTMICLLPLAAMGRLLTSCSAGIHMMNVTGVFLRVWGTCAG